MNEKHFSFFLARLILTYCKHKGEENKKYIYLFKLLEHNINVWYKHKNCGA